MKKQLIILLTALILVVLAGCTESNSQKDNTVKDDQNTVETVNEATKAPEPTVTPEPTIAVAADAASIVYMTKDISSEGLVKIYEALGRKATGKVAVKIHMGEPGGNNYLKPELVKDLVLSVNGTFVDCNTAYGGLRASTAAHLQAAKDHGFTEYASVDILDADGSMRLPIENGKHLKEDLVGAHFEDYDFIIALSHFKGHEMGGFGGAIKNISIGFASVSGKNYIHTAGASGKTMWLTTKQDDFLESMAEAAQAVADAAGENIIYINVMNNMSIDCDCNGHPAAPKMKDIGILASLDPVALDKACVDLVYAAPKEESDTLIARMEAKNGIQTLDYAQEIGLGTENYELEMIDD